MPLDSHELGDLQKQTGTTGRDKFTWSFTNRKLVIDIRNFLVVVRKGAVHDMINRLQAVIKMMNGILESFIEY